MKNLFFLAISLFSIFSLSAQVKNRSQLSGKVTDAKSGLPLQGASVYISDSKMGTTTDSTGNYILNNVSPGHSIIEVSYEGYRTIVQHIDVVAGNNSMNFTLSSSILENETVTI